MKRLLIALLALVALPLQAAQQLVVYNWADYLPKEVLKQFTKETGIKVKYSTYDTNEVMYAKVKTLKGKGYDIVVPSTYYIDKMRREGLLAPVDKSKLANFKNLDPKLLNQPYDPENAYSVPYLWGSTGIAVRTDNSPHHMHHKFALFDSRTGRVQRIVHAVEVDHVGCRLTDEPSEPRLSFWPPDRLCQCCCRNGDRGVGLRRPGEKHHCAAVAAIERDQSPHIECDAGHQTTVRSAGPATPRTRSAHSRSEADISPPVASSASASAAPQQRL